MSAFSVDQTKSAFGVLPAGESAFAKPAGGAGFGSSGGDLFAPEVIIDNPFDVLDDEAPPGETAEQYGERVFTLAEQEFKARAQRENERALDAVDTEFWFALYFQNRAQRTQFLELLAIKHLGERYLYGPDVAEVLGLALDPVEKRYNISDKLDAKYIELARPLPGA
jgi:hypothetical protein